MTEMGLHEGRPVRTAGAALESASAAIVLIHGRGGSAGDILPLGETLADEETAILAPNAAGNTWYPEPFMAPIERNEPWLTSALETVGRVVTRATAAGLPRSRIALCGFSQGACLATEFVARNPTRYRALLAFTGGLIGPPLMAFPHEGDLEGTPVYLSAGDTDPHIPWRRVEATRAVLERMRARVTLRRWPGRPHTILPREIEEARRLLA